jgi:thymidylate kinase
MTGDREGCRPAPFRFIVVSGCNGVGKSTVVRSLQDRVDAATFHYPAEFVRFREEAGLDTKVSALPRLLYYLGATLHLSDLVGQQLSRSHVICDRYLESPLSLLIAESALTEGEIDTICDPFRPYLCAPDLTLLLTAGHETACTRIRERLPARRTRVEQLVLQSPEFFYKREHIFRMYAAKLGPTRELDTTVLNVAEMCRAAWALVAELLGQRQLPPEPLRQ